MITTIKKKQSQEYNNYNNNCTVTFTFSALNSSSLCHQHWYCQAQYRSRIVNTQQYYGMQVCLKKKWYPMNHEWLVFSIKPYKLGHRFETLQGHSSRYSRKAASTVRRSSKGLGIPCVCEPGRFCQRFPPVDFFSHVVNAH